MNIDYSAIGTLPWMQQYKDNFEELIEKAERGDVSAEILVVNGAAHFYGLVVENFGDVPSLIDEIRSMHDYTRFS